MKKALKEILNKSWDVVDKVGEGIMNAKDNVLDGYSILARQGFKILSRFDEKLIYQDLLIFFNNRFAIAEGIYPTHELKKKIKENPDDLAYRLELYEKEQLQRELRFFLMINLSFTPFGRYISKQILENTKLEFQKQKDKNHVELTHLKEQVLDQLENIECDVQAKEKIKTLIRIKLLLEDHHQLNDFFDLFDSKEEIYFFQGIYYKQLGMFLEAEESFWQAFKNKIPCADDELLKVYDEIEKMNIADFDKSRIEVRRNLVLSKLGVTKTKLELIKGLPLNFIMAKINEFSNIVNKVGEYVKKAA